MSGNQAAWRPPRKRTKPVTLVGFSYGRWFEVSAISSRYDSVLNRDEPPDHRRRPQKVSIDWHLNASECFYVKNPTQRHNRVQDIWSSSPSLTHTHLAMTLSFAWNHRGHQKRAQECLDAWPARIMMTKILETIWHHSEDHLRAPGDMVVQHAMFVVMTVNQPTASNPYTPIQ